MFKLSIDDEIRNKSLGQLVTKLLIKKLNYREVHQATHTVQR